MTEIWRTIENYSDYEVSNTGRVRSYKRGWLKYLILSKCKGYFRITLYNNGSFRRFFVHHLVLNAFVGKCPDDYETNHKDGNKQNNNLFNLEWITRSENIKHAFKTGLKCFLGWNVNKVGEKTSYAKLKDNEVWLIKKLLYHNIKINLVSKMFKVSYNTVYQIKRGWYWKHVQYP